MSRQAALWALAALLGIALAAGVTWATSQLTSQHIGLSSEPLAAGSRLAPPVASTPTRTRSQPSRQRGAATVTSSTPGTSSPSTSSSAAPASSAPAESSAPVVPSAPVAPTATSIPTRTSRTQSSSADNGHSDQGAGQGGRHAGGRDD